MNLTPFIDTPFDDESAWEAFELAHGMAHEKFYAVLLGANLSIEHYPLFDTQENTDWKLIHQVEHQAIYDAIGLRGLPDLATVDMSKEDEFTDFMLYHAQVHAIINAALGIH